MNRDTERRTRRTRNKTLALGWFLQSCMLRQGTRALVLGSRDGLVVAAAGGGVDFDAAAAFAPFIFHESWDYPEPVEDRYFVDVIPLAGTPLYLFVVGASSADSRGARRTKQGICRIMDEEMAQGGEAGAR